MKIKQNSLERIIHINLKTAKPKYSQIIDSVCNAIETGKLKKGDKIPSINQICSGYNLSRDTVIQAFRELKSRGVLVSQPGKGHYVAGGEIIRNEKIFVMLDELNVQREEMFNTMISALKGKAHVDLFFHGANLKVFKNLILQHAGNFTRYVIMPGAFENINYLLTKLPRERVVILDIKRESWTKYSLLFQDFENDFYTALHEALHLLRKYRKLIFVSSGRKEFYERIRGFERFCVENMFEYQVFRSLGGNRPQLYEAWFLESDRDLVQIVKMAKEYDLKPGEKFGIVSFYDSLLKEVVAGGVTTISTDFEEMGKTLADMLCSLEKRKIRNPSKLIIRNSL